MKLNLSFVPHDGNDKEYKIVAFGDKESLLSAVKAVQLNNLCTNVFMVEDKPKEES